jgi:putative oxidoreductase
MMKGMTQEKRTDLALLVLRVTAGVIFVFHGYGKIFGGQPGMAGFTKMVTGLGFPLPGIFAWAAALSEFVGGIMLILGVYPSLAAVFTAIVMIVAGFMVKKGALPKADPDYALLAMSIAIILLGGGKYGLGRFLPKLRMPKMGGAAPKADPTQPTMVQQK